MSHINTTHHDTIETSTKKKKKQEKRKKQEKKTRKTTTNLYLKFFLEKQLPLGIILLHVILETFSCYVPAGFKWHVQWVFKLGVLLLHLYPTIRVQHVVRIQSPFWHGGSAAPRAVLAPLVLLVEQASHDEGDHYGAHHDGQNHQDDREGHC